MSRQAPGIFQCISWLYNLVLNNCGKDVDVSQTVTVLYIQTLDQVPVLSIIFKVHNVNLLENDIVHTYVFKLYKTRSYLIKFY